MRFAADRAEFLRILQAMDLPAGGTKFITLIAKPTHSILVKNNHSENGTTAMVFEPGECEIPYYLLKKVLHHLYRPGVKMIDFEITGDYLKMGQFSLRLGPEAELNTAVTKPKEIETARAIPVNQTPQTRDVIWKVLKWGYFAAIGGCLILPWFLNEGGRGIPILALLMLLWVGYIIHANRS